MATKRTTRRRTTKAAPRKAAPSKKAAPALSGRIELGPVPLVANQQLTITATGLPSEQQARISVQPGVRASLARTDRFGQLQTVFFPQAGRHSVVIEMASGTIKRDFDVAEQ